MLLFSGVEFPCWCCSGLGALTETETSGREVRRHPLLPNSKLPARCDNFHLNGTSREGNIQTTFDNIRHRGDHRIQDIPVLLQSAEDTNIESSQYHFAHHIRISNHRSTR